MNFCRFQPTRAAISKDEIQLLVYGEPEMGHILSSAPFLFLSVLPISHTFLSFPSFHSVRLPYTRPFQNNLY